MTPFQERSPQFSPDGRWLAYLSDETGQDEVYVVPYPGPGRKVVISTSGGREPVWSRDGRELFYRTPDELMVVAFETATGQAGVPTVLFADGYARDASPGAVSANYDVTPDGERFIMVGDADGATLGAIRVVLNWLDELEQDVASP